MLEDQDATLSKAMLPDRGGMRIPPPDVVSSWPAPNYTDPETRGNALLICNVIFQTLATIAVAGRLYSRFVKKWFGIDDAMIILAYVSSTQNQQRLEIFADSRKMFDVGLTAVIMLAKEQYGWDRHEWDLR